MSDWQERITRETAPAIRVEHQLRYELAAPLIRRCDTWADLGCGNGIAAAAALGEHRPAHAVLLDLDAETVARAVAELGLSGASTVCGDLSELAVLEQAQAALLSRPGPRIVTCFEVLEHLPSFVPLLEWSTRLAQQEQTTFVISVPNDAFWSIENPHHRTVWGEGAFAELTRLLPAQRTLLRQVALAGSAVVGFEGAPQRHELAALAGGEDAVATHFLAAFGPLHDQLSARALVAQTDTLAMRRWERERESNLALAEERVSHQIAEFKRWRAYIHELEHELGRPLSGSEDEPPR